MNIGINSGLACVGLQEVHASTGSRWRYAATGSMVNIAARVRELARDGSILITAEAASRVAEDFILEDLGENALKNVMNSVHVYRLVSEQSR
jgi:class 3 adenylate cyclase